MDFRDVAWSSPELVDQSKVACPLPMTAVPDVVAKLQVLMDLRCNQTIVGNRSWSKHSTMLLCSQVAELAEYTVARSWTARISRLSADR